MQEHNAKWENVTIMAVAFLKINRKLSNGTERRRDRDLHELNTFLDLATIVVRVS